MGLMEDLGAWLDQKKKNAANAGREIASQSVASPTGAATDYARGSAAGVGDMLDLFHKGMYPATSDLGAGSALRGLLGNTGSATEEAGGLFGFPGAGTAAKFATKGLLPMAAWTAWHGSPHKFDKFDLSKIGTGEGAQAYGHGLYMADAPDVATEYARNLANRDAANQNRLNAHANAQRLAKVAGDPKYAADDVRFALEVNADHPQKELLTDTLKFLESGDYAKPLANSGHLYKVDISDAKAPQDAFLQWDKPLSEQPKRVQDAMRKLGARPTDTGEQAYLYLQTKAPGLGAQDRYGQPIKRAEDYAGGLMREAGIPGIRYLDGGSRGAGSGTMNTVLFDDSLVKILERNGVPVEQPGLLAREPTGPAMSANPKNYQIAHKPMTDAGGAARLHDLVPAFGEDVYGKNALQYFGSGDQRERTVLGILGKVRGKPDELVTVYRGVPNEATGINPGDWVTLLPKVAADYGPKVVSMKVPARDITSWADSLLEFGYYPK
jgi:hypothetical protein